MSNFVKIARVEEVLPGERLVHDFDYDSVILLNVDGEFYCVADFCTHDEGPLADGELEGCELICPRHGARFDVRTGKETMPAPTPVPTYQVKIVDGEIFVEEPE